MGEVNPKDYEYCIEVERGKYHVVLTKDYRVKFLRGGDDWVDNPPAPKMLIALMSEYERLQNRLNEAERLLSDAHDILDDVHCYETETYEEISRYFEGGDGE